MLKHAFLLPLLLGSLLLLPACVGGTLSDTREFEMFPLRAASQQEGKGLKQCLQAAHKAQLHHKKKTGKWARKVKALPVDQWCDNYLMSQVHTPTGFEIRAEIREHETDVLWSVNEQGVIEEHLEGGEDEDLVL